MSSRLERIFQNTAQGPAGDCPLPEPGRGAPDIEDPGHLSVRNQPPGFNYDAEVNNEERARFRRYLEEMVTNGSITREQADFYI